MEAGTATVWIGDGWNRQPHSPHCLLLLLRFCCCREACSRLCGLRSCQLCLLCAAGREESSAAALGGEQSKQQCRLAASLWGEDALWRKQHKLWGCLLAQQRRLVVAQPCCKLPAQPVCPQECCCWVKI